jgi:hypothetical protein
MVSPKVLTMTTPLRDRFKAWQDLTTRDVYWVCALAQAEAGVVTACSPKLHAIGFSPSRCANVCSRLNTFRSLQHAHPHPRRPFQGLPGQISIALGKLSVRSGYCWVVGQAGSPSARNCRRRTRATLGEDMGSTPTETNAQSTVAVHASRRHAAVTKLHYLGIDRPAMTAGRQVWPRQENFPS